MMETLLAMTIVSMVSVTSVYILFFSLNLRDQTLATTKTEESIRVFERSFRQAALGAENISGDANSIFLRSESECWSFVYDSVMKNVKYSKILQEACIPNESPSELFFPTMTNIKTLSFSFSPITTGGNLVSVIGSMETVLPFDSHETTFSDSFVNLVD